MSFMLRQLSLGLATNFWTSAICFTALIPHLHVELKYKIAIDFRCPVTKIKWHLQTKLGIKTEVSN